MNTHLSKIEASPSSVTQYNFLQDAAYAVSTVSTQRSHVFYNVDDGLAAKMLARDIENIAGLYSMPVRSLDCDMRTQTPENIRKNIDYVQAFFTKNNNGLVLIGNLDHLIGADVPEPNPAQCRAAAGILDLLTEGAARVCAITTAKVPEEVSNHKVSTLDMLGSFASKSAYRGILDVDAATKILIDRGYDPESAALVIEEHQANNVGGAILYKNIAEPIAENAVVDLRRKLVSVK